MKLISKFLIVTILTLTALPLFADQCASTEVDMMFDQNKVFNKEYERVLLNSGMAKRFTLPFLKGMTKFFADMRCVGCTKDQYRAKVAKYLNRPYLVSNYLVAIASAGGLVATFFGTPAEGTFMASWYGKLIVSSMLISSSAYAGSNLKNEITNSGRQKFYEGKVVTRMKELFPNFDRVYASELREASFTKMEQAMGLSLKSTSSFLHQAATLARQSYGKMEAAASDPARYFALATLKIITFHPEYFFSLANRGRNPYDWRPDSKFDNIASLDMIETVMTEFHRKIFAAGQLKSMQPYLESPLPESQVIDFNAANFRAEIFRQIKLMYNGNNMKPMEKDAEKITKAFLARIVPHFKMVLKKYQLDKPKMMSEANWRRFLKDQGFKVIEGDPYVNDTTGTATAYESTIELGGRKIPIEQSSSQFNYYIRSNN